MNRIGENKMKNKKRPKNLSLIKPEDVDPVVWDVLMAAKSGYKNKLGKLLEEDPGLTKAEYWYTQPIHFAVRGGHLSTVKALLNQGADSTWIRYGHEDLITVARDRGHEKVAQFLAEDRAKHNVNRKLPIHDAVISGDADKVVRLLSSNPGLVSTGDEEGWTPLHHAVQKKDYRIVEYLCDVGAEICAQEGIGYVDLWGIAGCVLDRSISNGKVR